MTDPAARAADLLLRARRDHAALAGFPAALAPADAAAGYAVQAALVRRLAAEGGDPVGYKIGCTGAAAQALLGTDEPFYGRLLARFVAASPARLRAADFFMRIAEVEIAVRLAADLPAAAAPYDAPGVAAAVGAVIPAIEIADSRYRDWTRIGAPALIADNGAAGAWVRGAEVSGIDLAGLDELCVGLTVQGNRIRDGVGANALGHPMNALAWLANTLARQGRALRAGDLVTTGTCTEVYAAGPGDQLVADFGPLGTVEVGFE